MGINHGGYKMSVDNQKTKGYNKENHLVFLHSLVEDVKKECPDENVCVDEETAEVVWPGKKSSIQNKQEKKDKTIDGYFDKRKRDYPWL